MNKRSDNILVLGLVAILVIAGLAYFLGRTTAELDAGRTETTTATDDGPAVGEDTNGTGTQSSSDIDLESSSYSSLINSTPVSGYDDRTIGVFMLPPEALDTLDAIATDGPFPYSKDGSTFQNREGLLPDHDVGYYREYTVETPGSSDRGARRIVTGADGEMFYTQDHYESFEQIVAES